MSRRKKWLANHPPQSGSGAPVLEVAAPIIPTDESALVAALIPEVERAVKQAESMQPRFSADPQRFFTSTLRWVAKADTEAPPYASDSRPRDAWLQKFVMLEPHLAGILSSVASIDSNRGWTLTGGRNQVRRLTSSLHNFRIAPDITGWRPGVRSMSYAFHGMDLGAVTEIARDGDMGPLAGFYSVDPTQCKLTGNGDTPLQFYPALATKGQMWRPTDYMRITDISYNPERFNGLGWCSVSRALELAKIMIGVLQHDQEQLGSRMPKGLLLLKGISESQWNTAMEAREARLTQKERQYYGGVEVLASGQEDISANLVALSSLPAGFDLRTFTELTMYGYALCFGYDAREFWPVSGGALGTATETEVQHRKATQKGAGDFSLAHQEQMQREDVLPETVQFEYEERDIEGQKAEIELNLLHAEFASSLYTAGLMQGAPLITQQQALQLLADANVIPQEWTAIEEDVTATDDEAVDTQAQADQKIIAARSRGHHDRVSRDRLLSIDSIYRAAESFPREAIVRYQWPRNMVTVLAQSGERLLQRRVFLTSGMRAFDDSQPRDETGKWTGDGGGSSGSSSGGSSSSGTATTSEGYQAVETRESEIRNQDHESAFAVGADGATILNTEGDAHTVGFTASEVKAMKDGVLTHNHPNGWSFTETDIRLASKAKLGEIRAVTKDGIFIMRRPAKGWPSAAKFGSMLADATSEVSDSLWTKIRSGFERSKQIKASDADRTHWDMLWQNMADKMGATYINEGNP